MTIHDAKSPHGSSEIETEKGVSQVEHAINLDENAKLSDFKAGAIEAENAEHNMGVIDAVKAYPMATFWAFIMSCTIVSFFFPSSSLSSVP